MKIMQILHYPGQGGAEQYAYLLAKQALRDGNEVVFVFGQEGPLEQRIKKLGCPIYRVKMRAPYDAIAAKEIADLYKKEKPDIVQTHFMRENFLAVAASKLAPVGAIFQTVHRLEPKTFSQAKVNQIFSLGLTKFIAVSDLAKEYLEKEGIGRHKIVVIPNGAEIGKFNKEKIKKELGIGKEKVISYVGRFTAEKGHDILLKAFKELKPKKIKLILVGDGPDKSKYLKYVEKHELKNRVIFTGNRDNGYQVIGISDIYVQPSQIENMPISIIEAMLQKIPIVASANDAHKAMLKDGLHGKLFRNKSYKDLKVRLEQTLADETEAKEKAKEAYKFVKKRFTAEIMWTKTKRLYQNALQNSAFKK